MLKRQVYRRSDTGHFTSKEYAKKHPKTTFCQTIRLASKKTKIASHKKR